MTKSLPVNWVQMTDPNTGKTYYANTATKETQWAFPAH